MATIACELNEMVTRYPDRSFVTAQMRLTGEEWAEFIAFMGTRDDWLIAPFHVWQCDYAVKSVDKSGHLATLNLTTESFTLAKMFVAGFPPLALGDSERITPTYTFHIAEEGYPVFEPC